MKAAAFGFVLALLFVAAASAHNFAGWPALRAVLEARDVAPDDVGAMAAGWRFGSVFMLATALLVGIQARRALAGGGVDRASLAVLAAAYVAFGAVGFVARDFRAHFLGFVVFGALITLFAATARSADGRAPRA